MWAVEVWVFGKGWKLISKHRDVNTAHKKAVEFHPLETRVSGKLPYGTEVSYYGGVHCGPTGASDKNPNACDQEYLDKYTLVENVHAS